MHFAIKAPLRFAIPSAIVDLHPVQPLPEFLHVGSRDFPKRVPFSLLTHQGTTETEPIRAKVTLRQTLLEDGMINNRLRHIEQAKTVCNQSHAELSILIPDQVLSRSA